MANTTPNLNLSVTPESTNKSFKAWRLEMDNDTNSNMTKIDEAYGNLFGTNNPPTIANVSGLQNALNSKADVSGGGSITIGPVPSPRLTLISMNASSGAGTGKTELLKSASTAVDYGTFLTDYEWGDGTSANNSRVILCLHSSAPNLKDRIQFGDCRVGDTGLKYYNLYGEHNKPTAEDIQGLEQKYKKLTELPWIRAGEDLNTLRGPGSYMAYSTSEARQILNTPGADATTKKNAGIVTFVVDVMRWNNPTAKVCSQTLRLLSGKGYHRYTNDCTVANPTWTDWAET